MSFQARHTKLLKFMIGSMKSEIPKFPEFSLKMHLRGKLHIIYSNLLFFNQTSLTVSRILRCSVSPNVVNWLSFLKVAPEWSAWFKNFSSTWQRPLIRKLIVEFFAKVLEYFETLEFYLENSNIYNEDFYLFLALGMTSYSNLRDIQNRYLNLEYKWVFLISFLRKSFENLGLL